MQSCGSVQILLIVLLVSKTFISQCKSAKTEWPIISLTGFLFLTLKVLFSLLAPTLAAVGMFQAVIPALNALVLSLAIKPVITLPPGFPYTNSLPMMDLHSFIPASVVRMIVLWSCKDPDPRFPQINHFIVCRVCKHTEEYLIRVQLEQPTMQCFSDWIPVHIHFPFIMYFWVKQDIRPDFTHQESIKILKLSNRLHTHN